MAAAALQHALNATWGDHPIAGRNHVRVVAANAGLWAPTQACATPALWILLVGHYRTFSWTRDAWRRMATQSASGCSMAVAFMPEVVDVPDAERRWWRKHDVGWRQIASARDGVPALLADAQQAFPNLAYVVVHRIGAVNGFPACLALYWHGAWAATRWVARTHGLAIDPSSVVLRARPDVILPSALSLGRLRTYFAAGQRGRHLMFGPGADGQVCRVHNRQHGSLACARV